MSGPSDDPADHRADDRADDRAQRRAALHAPLRPWRSRQVALAVGAAQALAFVVLAVVAPADGPLGFRWYDRVLTLATGAAVGWVLWRFASVEAVPAENGLRVRNLLERRELQWAQIVTVRFGGGGPWAVLDLSDGQSLTVMAIQRSDGVRAEQAAQRLATLVDLHSRPDS